jgi:peptide/nickel transport system substrate-binding protein
MVLEPTGLDPTTAPAAAIGEVVHYNVLEGPDQDQHGRQHRAAARRELVDRSGRQGLHLQAPQGRQVPGRRGRSTRSDVKFTFERAKAAGSTNKAKKAVFDNISRIETPDPHTVILVLNQADGNFLFRMGENTAVILDPKSAPTTATKPVGTGPFKFDTWAKGSSLSLVKSETFRNRGAVKLSKVTFRFINDPAAQVAALLAGDIDGMPRFGALESLKQLQSDARFTVMQGGTEGKTIVSMNNRKKPFDDVAGAPRDRDGGRPQGGDRRARRRATANRSAATWCRATPAMST